MAHPRVRGGRDDRPVRQRKRKAHRNDYRTGSAGARRCARRGVVDRPGLLHHRRHHRPDWGWQGHGPSDASSARGAWSEAGDGNPLEPAMRAVVVEEFGPAENLRLVDLQKPIPRPGEVIVKVAFCGVNFIDVYFRTGLYKVPPPVSIGSEASGIVD